MTSQKLKTYMKVNVILTFNTYGGLWGGTQEIFDMKLLVSKKDEKKNVVEFLNNKFFKRIAKACINFNRSPHDLVKICTGSDWKIYEDVTGNKSLASCGHPCKWYFGNGRNDLDLWEKNLMTEYGFGTDADMSWIEEFREKIEKQKISA